MEVSTGDDTHHKKQCAFCIGDDTHHKKQCAFCIGEDTHNSKQYAELQELIFIKTIQVRNLLNQPVGLTYPKRAKGLVKHNRAVWLNEDTIQLLDSQKGEFSMSVKEALIATINEMSETQVRALLVFLDTFKNKPAEVKIPSESVPVTDSKETVRTEMLKTLQNRMDNLDYSSPNTENVLKELKDMLNMLLRV